MSTKASYEEISHRGYRGRLINWEQWCDGEGHILESGKDFRGERADSTRMAGTQWAKRHGLRPRTVIITPEDDNLLSLAADIEALAGDPPSDDDELSDALHAFAKRARDLNPKFYFEIIEGLSDEQIALAKRLQALASDEAVEVLSQERRAEREAQRPVYEPVAERRERLSDRAPREVLAESRPMARRRRV